MTDEVSPIVVAGDWHGALGIGLDAIRAAHAVGARAIILAGDLGLDFPGAKRRRLEARLDEGLTIGGLRGAYSVDQQWRTQGKDWWADEEPTPEEAHKLVAAGHVDVLLTHDVPWGVPMTGDFELSPEIEARANQTRFLLQSVVEKLQPPLNFCRHWHARKIRELAHDSGLPTTGPC